MKDNIKSEKNFTRRKKRSTRQKRSTRRLMERKKRSTRRLTGRKKRSTRRLMGRKKRSTRRQKRSIRNKYHLLKGGGWGSGVNDASNAKKIRKFLQLSGRKTVYHV